MNKEQKIYDQLEDHNNLVNEIKRNYIGKIVEISDVIVSALKNNNKILIFGNGGSAADAQHIAAEFTGRFKKERKGLSAIALTTDTSAITAIGNDYGFDKIFSRQVEAIANRGDVLIGISTSGNSVNVINGLEEGKLSDCFLISLTGNCGGKLKEIANLNLNINHQVTARIQEMHILIAHLICELVDTNFN